jgi:hypothetical protein
MENVVQLRPRCTSFARGQAVIAARYFHGTVQLAALHLIQKCDDKGQVLLTTKELGRLIGRGRWATLKAVQTLTDDPRCEIPRCSVLERDPKISWLYTWNVVRIDELVQHVLAEDAKFAATHAIVSSSEPTRSYIQELWITSLKYARSKVDRYRKEGISVRSEPTPKPENWIELETWPLKMAAKGTNGETPEVAIKDACYFYVRDNTEILIQKRHILPFLTFQLERIEPKVTNIWKVRAKKASESDVAPRSSISPRGAPVVPLYAQQARAAYDAIGGAR